MRHLFSLFSVLAIALVGCAADDKKDEKPKFPDLEAKEWKKLDNGMKVLEAAEGKGDECPNGATVTIHYTGWLTDGTQFDSSRSGNPAEFPLGDLIKGWQEGVPGMKAGSKRYFVIPPELGYGARKAGKIPANSTLVFEIELKSFKK
jgi:FKBP-type peptidyl-prolyl cis-trans isomerase